MLDVGALKDGTTYLVMELIDGMTVDELLRRHGALPLARVVEIMAPVAEVLTYAHSEGVIHRDVKPANVMLHGGPSGEVVKVLDFGVAKLIDVGVEIPAGHLSGDSENSGRIVAGSPAYLAPERLRGVGYDGRADVYSLGVMLYEMLTGSVPFLSPDGDLMKVAVMHLKKTPEPQASATRAFLKRLTLWCSSCSKRTPTRDQRQRKWLRFFKKCCGYPPRSEARADNPG